MSTVRTVLVFVLCIGTAAGTETKEGVKYRRDGPFPRIQADIKALDGVDTAIQGDVDELKQLISTLSDKLEQLTACLSPPEVIGASYSLTVGDNGKTASYQCDMSFIKAEGSGIASYSVCVKGVWTGNVDLLCRERCPSNYIWDKGTNLCYNIFPNGKTDFHTAQTVCKLLHGGRLVVLNSSEKFELVQALLKISDKGEECVWVGAERHLNGRISWDDGSQIQQDLWGPGEPNDYNEKCMCLFSRFGYLMNDDTCGEINRFVCEIPM